MGLPSKRTAARVVGITAIAAACFATLAFNYFTLAGILRAPTRVPWADEWAMIQEFIHYKQGDSLLPILWSSFWGHRLVIPRLIYFANLQWASWGSLIRLTLAIQTAHIALLCTLAWALVGRNSRALFAISVAVILNLMLSPLQMQNFVWSMQFMFPLVYAAASAAFLGLAFHRASGRYSMLFLCVAAAVAASLTMPNGLMTWPTLVAQAMYLRLRRRVIIALALTGAGIIAAYGWHYAVAPLGMGIADMVRHPLDAVMLVGLLLGGALNSLPVRLGIASALLALAGAVYLGVKTLRPRSPDQAWLSALVAILAFHVLCAASTVAGRLSPEWLSGNPALPSRYFTLIDAFWASLAILVLYRLSAKPRSFALAACAGAVYLCLMFLNARQQVNAAHDWSDFFRGADALGAAILLNAPDQPLLSVLWTPKAQRDDITAYLRANRLSVFAEPRAAWPGKRISELYQRTTAEPCTGRIERSLALEDGGGKSWRVEGWAWDTRANRGFEYLVIADGAGLVIGMARGGFRHRYFPGLFADNPVLPVPHMRFPASEWLGYVRQPAKSTWTVYGLLPQPDRLCMIEEMSNSAPRP